MRAKDCKCGMIFCICELIAPHKEDCAFRVSLACPVGIACEPHGRDTCPICDKCNCGAAK